jgi:spermidine synthase
MKSSLRILLLTLFFLSGVTGLGYEVLWGKWLGTVFGSSAWAIATTLSAFMAGLALGSYAAGRLKIINTCNPFLLYGLLELGIGTYAIFFPSILNLTDYLQGHFAFGWIDHYALYNLLRFILCLFAIIIPTTLMGATLPLLSEYLSRRESSAVQWSGYLYGSNTLGAFTGTIVSGFFLIAAFGLRKTNLVFVCINFAVGLTAIIYVIMRDKNNTLSYVSPSIQTNGQPDEQKQETALYPIILIIFFINGLCNLAYEVLWTKALGLIIGCTTYAFTLMLGIFLAGIALGSLYISRKLNTIKNILLLFIICQVGMGLWVIASPLLINQMPTLFLKGLLLFGMTWNSLIVVKIILCTVLIAPLTLLSGAVFPLGFKLAFKGKETLKSEIANLYGINTAGGILGSFVAGFITIPLFGMEMSLKIIALLHILLVIGLLLKHSTGKQVLAAYKMHAIIISVIIIVLAVTANWDKKVLASGVYFQPRTFIDEQGGVHVKDKMALVTLKFHGEGIGAVVDVLESPGGYRALSINGQPVASSNFYDYRVQRLLGILPLMLHPKPEHILVIGLGTGMTSGTGAIDKLSKDIKIVELNKDVVRASDEFKSWNLNVLSQPNVSVTIEDALHYLKYVNKKYDIITSDPIHPFLPGSSNLYALDHYKISLEKLNPGGIFCQWVPLYQLNEIDVKTILKTFAAAFDNATMWATGTDFILCGAKGNYLTKPQDFYYKASLPEYKQILQLLGFWKPEEVLMSYVGELSKTTLSLKDAPLNTIDYPFLEFSAAKAILDYTVGRNLKLLYQSFNYEIPAFVTSDSTLVNRLNELKPCTLILQQGFVAEQNGQFDIAIRAGKLAYTTCPYTGHTRYFAAHTIVHAVNDIMLTDKMKAYQMLSIAKQLDPYDPEIDIKLNSLK